MNSDTKLTKQPYAITMSKHRLNIHEFRIMTKVVQALQPNMAYGKDRSSIEYSLLEDITVNIPINYFQRAVRTIQLLNEHLNLLRRKSSIFVQKTQGESMKLTHDLL